MRAFVFSLQRALSWRGAQLELEENKLRQLQAARDELSLAAVRLDLLQSRAEQTVREAQHVDARDLWALADYRQRLIADRHSLDLRRQACEAEVAAQRQRVLDAQRQFRLLEKLEQRRHAAWRLEADKETEAVSAESYLAGWARRGAGH